MTGNFFYVNERVKLTSGAQLNAFNTCVEQIAQLCGQLLCAEKSFYFFPCTVHKCAFNILFYARII